LRYSIMGTAQVAALVWALAWATTLGQALHEGDYAVASDADLVACLANNATCIYLYARMPPLNRRRRMAWDGLADPYDSDNQGERSVVQGETHANTRGVEGPISA
jgi:hypothetical protein